MRSGINMLLAIAVAGGIAACDTRDVETFEGEETATPSLEGPTMDAVVLTADIEPVDEATGFEDVDGEVRILRLGAMDETGATPRTDAPRTDEGLPRADSDRPVAGEARTTEANQGFRVEVTLEGLPQAAEHAWHIHAGSCDEAGPIVVAFTPEGDMEGIAQPLRVGDDGRATGSATVPGDQLALNSLEDGEYALHVHQNPGADHGPSIACANLNGGLGVF